MRPLPPIATAIADQLHALAAGLRTGSTSLGDLPTALVNVLSQLTADRGPDSSEIIQREDSPPIAADLVQQLEAFIKSHHTRSGALDVHREPVMELVVEDGTGEAGQSAARLLGLMNTDGPGRTRNIPPGSTEIASSPRPPFLPDAETRAFILNPLPASRYEPRDVLGAGGQGDVRELYDKSLQRVVALKILRDEFASQPHSRKSFLREACLTAQLSHPCIVPIYDVGELASGAPCYTMKRIRGRSLRDILVAIRRGETWTTEYTRRRLLEILVQVAHAVGYAHHRGVVHRDLKPANVMIGDYGEVLVVDWGIARLVDSSEKPSAEGPVILDPQHEKTVSGTIKGTPAYMAPEQARADLDAVGRWTDVHALGLILFEVLIGEPARGPGSAEGVVVQARKPITLSPEARRLAEGLEIDPIPEELDQICMRCLADETGKRYPDAEAFARALRGYLEGQRRRELAETRATEGEARARAFVDLNRKVIEMNAQVERARNAIDPWAEIEQKRALWQLELAAQELERERDEALAQATASFTQALDDDADNRRARSGLARLYYDRLQQAEQLGRVRDARQFEAQVRRLDDGTLAEKLRGYGSLYLQTVLDRAELWLYRYEMMDRMLRPVDGRRLGRSPVDVEALPMGRYLVVVRMRGGREVYYPVLIRRQSRWEGTIQLHPELDDRFIHVPAGPFIFGGDRQAPGAVTREERWVGDFAIGRLPITCREYLRFLNSMPLERALEHVPRTARLHGGIRWWPVENGHIELPRVDEAGGRWDPRYPVRYISRRDAETYASWRASVEGLPLRLPTEAEWEKAGRGVDGRIYPWGDAFDATFCKMRDSRPGRPEPEPAGAFPTDRSPYGVQDLAGGISEWCADPFDRYQLLGTIKGGYWRGAEATCRLARRFASDADEPAPFAGFRLVLDLPAPG